MSKLLKKRIAPGPTMELAHPELTKPDSKAKNTKKSKNKSQNGDD